MQLYDMKMAPNPRRVRVFLAEKGLAVPLVEVDVQAGANLQPDFLAVNPRGVVPTLVLDDGRMLDESIAICRYLECLHPEPNLFGRDPWEVAEVERWQRRMEFEGMFGIAAAFRNTAPAYAGRSMPGTAGGGDQLAVLAERGLKQARGWLDSLEARMAGRDWLASNRYTVADITALVCLDFAKWVGLRAGDSHPALAAYLARLKARPSAAA